MKGKEMAIKPRSRAHEDRLCKLECELANLRTEFRLVYMGNALLKPKPRTIWQRLNDYFSR